MFAVRVLEYVPQGDLTPDQIARLRHRMLAEIREPGAVALLSGIHLRYRGPEGLAALAELLEEVQATGTPVWLCHLGPLLLSAIHLGALGDAWHITPDRRTALERIAASQEQDTASFGTT